MSADRPLTFDPCFGKLGREITRFANHTQRFVTASQRYREVLTKASEWTDGTAPLDRHPSSPAAAMRAIDKFARIHRENRHTLFGAYFAHHYLRMQAELSRELLRNSFNVRPTKRVATCWKIHEIAVAQRREWVSALIECSIAAAAPELSPDKYVVYNVGALIDHEDVDLAIVVSSVEARQSFAKGFSKLTKTFVRFASKIQLFLSDQLGHSHPAAMIEEYEQVLQDKLRSVPVVMQLLGAEYLCGSRALAKKFEDRVISRFYAESGEALAHESFLRSVMAELRHVRTHEMTTEVLAPKRDIYLPSKLTTGAMRVIHGVREAHPPNALRALAERDPERRDVYEQLADVFVQNEVLRALLFLYVIKADQIDFDDPTIVGAGRRVAVLLGLGKSARRTAEFRLLNFYKDIRARGLQSVFSLSYDVSKHLRKVSTFRQILERGQEISSSNANLALRLVYALKRFEGGVFWDEVVELLSATPDVQDRFFGDLLALDESARVESARELVRMMCADAASMVEFMVFVAARDRKASAQATMAESGPISTMFWQALLHILESDANVIDGFIERLDAETETEALHRLSMSYSPSRLSDLAAIIERYDNTTRGERVVRALRSVIILVHHHSNRTGRIANRVLARVPEFVHRLGDAERVRALARDLMTSAARERRPEEQVQLLGDAFDVSAMNASLVAILEGAPADRDADFIAAFDLYLRELYKACFREVRDRSKMFENLSPGTGIAVYATGGFGRGEGFGADWDYLAVVGDDDRGLKKFFGKVIQRLAAAMTRRGVIPHNRLANEFNSYVVSIKELKNYLSHRKTETFIDEAEIIEARFMFGDAAVRNTFDAQVHGMVMNENRQAFLREILVELEDRRTALPVGLNIKHGAGGLREIHLLWLAVGAWAKLNGPFRPQAFAQAAAVLPDHRADLRFLIIGHAELRRVRDLYRLVVADQEDPIDAQALVEIAKDLEPLERAGARGDFGHEVHTLMRACQARIDIIADKIRSEIAS